VSSLIFYTDENQALIATDTLAVSNNKDRTPFTFTTKAFPLPHLRMIIAGTGLGRFSDDWLVNINSSSWAGYVDRLDHQAPSKLAALWQLRRAADPSIDQLTTTVYHFGFSEDDGLMRVYAYKSGNNFLSEPLPYGIATKPPVEVTQPFALPEDLPNLMQRQRDSQLLTPEGDRVYIGGEIHVIHLTQSGFYLYRYHTFDDFDSDRSKILA